MVAIFVLLTFIIFIVVDLLVLKAQKKTHPAFEPAYRPADLSVFSKANFMVPEGIYFSRGHTWAQRNEYGLVKIGIDEFVTKALGKLTVSKIAENGQIIKRGDVIIEGNLGSKSLKFRSPLDGVVKFINDNIVGKNINDPYGNDWGLLMLAENYNENRKTLMSGIELKNWIKEEFRRLKEFLNTHSLKPELAGVTMYDGGNVVEGAVALIKEESLQDFEKEFLTI